jgi:hypothetical protein
MEVILDPERFFDDPGYIMEVSLGFDDEPGDPGDGSPVPPRPWRMLVLEDCDELLQADAKRRTGQALARLLNLTDGLIGQGLAVLVALTTNEPLTSLHPAVIRPGRCLAEIHVDALSRGEAQRWLGRRSGVPAAGATLAELFARRDERTNVTELRPAPAAGHYL